MVLTGEIAEQSDFDEGVIEAQRADWTARQAIATDDTMVAATRAADIIAKSENPEIKRLRERVQKGFSTASDRNGHGWSWTQIQKFHNDRDTWFREYVQGKRDKTIPVSTTIGSAFHKAAEMHLRQLAGEEIEGPYAGKTSSEIFDMFLEGKTQEGREQGGQENFNRNKLRPDNKAKYDRSKHALSLIDDLFNRLGVTKVLGAEQTVSPDFAPEGMDVWTTGSTDA